MNASTPGEGSSGTEPAPLPYFVTTQWSVVVATSDLARPLRTRLAIGADFCQLSGEDATVVPFLAQGGVGCI